MLVRARPLVSSISAFTITKRGSSEGEERREEELCEMVHDSFFGELSETVYEKRGCREKKREYVGEGGGGHT